MVQPRTIAVVAGSNADRLALEAALQTHAAAAESPVELTIHPDVGDGTTPANATVAVVVSAVTGVDAATEQAWQGATASGAAPVLVVTDLDGPDKPVADYLGTVAACRRAFGDTVRAIGVPVVGAAAERAAGDGEPTGVVGLLSWTLFDESSGVLTLAPAGNDLVQNLLPVRQELLERIVTAAEDERLQQRIAAGHRLAHNQLIDALRVAVARRGITPVLPVNPATGLGILPLLELLVLAQ